jgi:arginyl-tRNA synthetase
MFYTRFLELSVQNYEPYFFVNYLTQLATEFHKLWEKEKFIDEDENKTFLKLSVISGVKRLIKEGLKNLGINAIEQM